MWALKNDTPYAAERTWVRDKQGMHHWIVAVKATFTIGDDGALTLADEQLPPLLEPEYWGEPGVSSVRYEADLGLMKPATDVLVNASAYAPRGLAAKSVAVSLRRDAFEKTLVVYGERVYQEGLSGGVHAREGVAFTSQPIRYELAWGGTDTRAHDAMEHGYDARNPIGRGYAKDPTNLVGERAHQVEYADGDLSRGPAGFGAIASYWSPRRELAGTYDGQWVRSKKPLLPDDYDDRFTLAAPADQRVDGYLRGGERFELVNMTPGAVMRFTLPKLYFAFNTSIDRRREEHRGRLVTVLVEPDERRLLMTWQTALPVNSADCVYLDVTRIREKPYLA